MSNPKVRSLGRRGGQKTSDENGEVKKKGSYSYQVDDETRDIVKSLFEEYASDDGKNFYSGNRDERAEKEHEDFINEVDRQLDAGERSEAEADFEEEAAVSPLRSKVKAVKAEEPKQEEAEAPEKEEAETEAPEKEAAEAETAAAAEPAKPKNKSTKIREKRVSSFRTPKTAEASDETPETEKAAEEKDETKADKKIKAKTKKRKAAGKMNKKPNSKNEEFYDECDDGYEEYDEYEDEYDDEYEDEYEDGDEFDDEYEEPKRSGGGVEFSLKIVSLTIVLVIVLLIMTALFINNRSLSRELQEKTAQYDELVVQYTTDLEQLNATIDGLKNPQSETTETTVTADSDASAESSDGSDSDSDSSSGSENYYVVQSGDTLSKIAASELGSSSLYYLIQEANDMGSSTNLSVGDRLIIPDVE